MKNSHLSISITLPNILVNKAVFIKTNIARKTFANTKLLYNDIPLEIVSTFLGHSKIQTTQEHYGKVFQKKVRLEMNKLKLF